MAKIAEFTDIEDAAYGMSERHRAEAWCDMNRWKWPALLRRHKPAEWDTLGERERMKLPAAITLWNLLSEVPLKTRLREWNRERMNDAEFEAFWSEMT